MDCICSKLFVELYFLVTNTIIYPFSAFLNVRTTQGSNFFIILEKFLLNPHIPKSKNLFLLFKFFHVETDHAVIDNIIRIDTHDLHRFTA